MSLRRLSLRKVVNAGVALTRNHGIEGDDDSGDPSKPRKPTTFALVVKNSIWFFRTSQGVFSYALTYTRRFVQNTVAMLMNGVGFFCSVMVDISFKVRDEGHVAWLPLLADLKLFLEKSGIGEELARGFSNYLFFSNVAVLKKIQHELWKKKGATGEYKRLDRRRMALLEASGSDEKISQEKRNSIINEGKRLMKYATAAYGPSMIDAAEIDVYGSIRTSKMIPTSNAIDAAASLLSSLKESLEDHRRQFQHDRPFFNEDIVLGRISEHIGIPGVDIYKMNLLDDQVEALRYFVAVDHENKAVVLSLRGSFSIQDILIDIAAFSRPFCGGEAHSEMANVAEKVWDEAKDTITNLLSENQDYELILTGHSLGGGAATLLNILLHQDNREKVDGRAIRCFVFACPPVFAGEISKEASEACINYIFDSDIVPFLSVDSVRRLFAALHSVEKSNLSAWIRFLILWGSTEVINPPTLQRVESALHEPPPAKEGAPELLIPAHTNVWMRYIASDFLDINDLETLNLSSASNFVLTDSARLAKIGIWLDPSMIINHFPNGYERALHHLQ